jgi:hypothetical protein
MTEGFAWVVCEFAIITHKGVVTQQKTAEGYSKIHSINTESQREYLYESAINHARSKYLYSINKPSPTDCDFAVVNSGFKRVTKTKEGFNRPLPTRRRISLKAKHRAEQRVLIKADEIREDKNKMVTQKEKQKMYKEPKIYKEPKSSRVKRIAQEFSALTPKEKKELINILSKSTKK